MGKGKTELTASEIAEEAELVANMHEPAVYAIIPRCINEIPVG